MYVAVYNKTLQTVSALSETREDKHLLEPWATWGIPKFMLLQSTIDFLGGPLGSNVNTRIIISLYINIQI